MLAENIGETVEPGRRRPGRPSLSNAELLDKALDLFLTQGFDRTSIEAICAAAGMAKRTVYARYGDKTSLFKAALQRAIEEWIVPVEQLRAAEAGDLEECLLAVGQILVANIMSPAGLRLLRLSNAESGRMPEIGAFTVRQGTEPTIAYLADLFRRHLDPGGTGLVDVEAAGRAFLNLVVGGPGNAAALGVPLQEAEINRDTVYSVRLFLHGLLPDRGANADGGENRRLAQLLDESLAALDAARERIALAKAAGQT